MDKVLMRELFNTHMRIDISYPGYQKERAASVIRHVSLTSEPGFVIFSELDDTNADAVIEEQINYFRQLKQPFEWKVFDYDQPLDLKERLQANGFTIEEPEALMLFNLTQDAPLLKIPVRSEIKQITTEQGIWDIIGLENEVWGESHQELGERLIRDLQSDNEELFVYAGYLDGKAVSAAWMYLHKDTPFASLWGGSTLPEYRKKGYYSSLLAIRALEAAARGYQLLMVDASTMSQPILEKHGFECHAMSTPCMSPTSHS